MDPEISLLISTFERPTHLARALLSIECQENVDGQFEVIVTDDGSTDHTCKMIEAFASRVSFPVRWTTHAHDGFQLARCRNEGVAASQAPYLLFLDGDCILPPDHVAKHLARRKPRTVVAGDCCRLDEPTSKHITETSIRRAEYMNWLPVNELRRMRKQYRQSIFYNWLRHPTKPKLIGNNIALWREDFERVNGFDENFVGWGCEDDDLRMRLRRTGVQIESILNETYAIHLWHPPHSTVPESWSQGANVEYLLRKGRLTCCRNGLKKRSTSDLRLRVVGNDGESKSAEWTPTGAAMTIAKTSKAAAEVEVLVWPGTGRFSGKAECNVLLTRSHEPAPPKLRKLAHLVVEIESEVGGDTTSMPPTELIETALRAVA